MIFNSFDKIFVPVLYSRKRDAYFIYYTVSVRIFLNLFTFNSKFPTINCNYKISRFLSSPRSKEFIRKVVYEYKIDCPIFREIKKEEKIPRFKIKIK